MKAGWKKAMIDWLLLLLAILGWLSLCLVGAYVIAMTGGIR